MKRAFADFCGCSGDQECNSCARPGTSRIRSPPANVSTNDSPLLRSLLHPKRLSKIIIHSNKLIKKPRIETIIIEDTQPEIIEIPDTQPQIIEIPDSQPQIIEIPDTQPQTIEILDTQPIKTIEIPNTQQILDSVLENDFGMGNEFGDISLLNFFDNKSGESENVDVDVNDHRDGNLDHYSEVVINDLYNQCQLGNNDQGVHDDDYVDLVPTFDENLLNSQQLIDRHQMRDNNYDCQRLMDVENKRSQMRDNDQGYQRLVEVGEDLEDVDDIGSNSPAPIIDNILEIQSVADGVNQRGGDGELHHPLIQAVEMDEINMDVDDGVSEASSIASDRLGDDIDNSLTEEQHLCRVVDDAEELTLQEQVLQDQIDEEQRLCRVVDDAEELVLQEQVLQDQIDEEQRLCRVVDDVEELVLQEQVLQDQIDEEQRLCRVVDDAEELVLQERVLQDQIDEEQRLYRAVDAALIQNVRNISHDLSVALRDLSG
jgi:hypothetical protein